MKYVDVIEDPETGQTWVTLYSQKAAEELGIAEPLAYLYWKHEFLGEVDHEWEARPLSEVQEEAERLTSKSSEGPGDGIRYWAVLEKDADF